MMLALSTFGLASALAATAIVLVFGEKHEAGRSDQNASYE